MTAKIADRVKETTTTTGTGTLSLDGAVSGFQTFVAGIGTGKACYYAIVGGAEWEVGIGTVTDATPDTLSRDTILASSNSNAVVTLSTGTKDVFCTMPAASVPTLLGQVSASSSATVNLEGIISAAYDRYRIELVNVVPATDNVEFLLRVGTGAGPTYDSTSGHYKTATIQADGSTAGSRGSTSATTSLELGNGLTNSSTAGGFCGTVDVSAPGSTSFNKLFVWRSFRANQSGVLLATSGGGSYLATTAVTAIQFLMSSGNVASGIFRIFGIPKF